MKRMTASEVKAAVRAEVERRAGSKGLILQVGLRGYADGARSFDRALEGHGKSDLFDFAKMSEMKRGDWPNDGALDVYGYSQVYPSHVLHDVVTVDFRGGRVVPRE